MLQSGDIKQLKQYWQTLAEAVERNIIKRYELEGLFLETENKQETVSIEAYDEQEVAEDRNLNCLFRVIKMADLEILKEFCHLLQESPRLISPDLLYRMIMHSAEKDRNILHIAARTDSIEILHTVIMFIDSVLPNPKELLKELASHQDKNRMQPDCFEFSTDANSIRRLLTFCRGYNLVWLTHDEKLMHLKNEIFYVRKLSNDQFAYSVITPVLETVRDIPVDKEYTSSSLLYKDENLLIERLLLFASLKKHVYHGDYHHYTFRCAGARELHQAIMDYILHSNTTNWNFYQQTLIRYKDDATVMKNLSHNGRTHLNDIISLPFLLKKDVSVCLNLLNPFFAHVKDKDILWFLLFTNGMTGNSILDRVLGMTDYPELCTQFLEIIIKKVCIEDKTLTADEVQNFLLLPNELGFLPIQTAIKTNNEKTMIAFFDQLVIAYNEDIISRRDLYLELVEKSLYCTALYRDPNMFQAFLSYIESDAFPDELKKQTIDKLIQMSNQRMNTLKFALRENTEIGEMLKTVIEYKTPTVVTPVLTNPTTIVKPITVNKEENEIPQVLPAPNPLPHPSPCAINEPTTKTTQNVNSGEATNAFTIKISLNGEIKTVSYITLPNFEEIIERLKMIEPDYNQLINKKAEYIFFSRKNTAGAKMKKINPGKVAALLKCSLDHEFYPNEVIFAQLVYAMCEKKFIAEATMIFDLAVTKNLKTMMLYASMIMGLSDSNQIDEAERIYDDAQKYSASKPTEYLRESVYNKLIPAAIRSGKMDLAQRVHAEGMKSAVAEKILPFAKQEETAKLDPASSVKPPPSAKVNKETKNSQANVNLLSPSTLFAPKSTSSQQPPSKATPPAPQGLKATSQAFIPSFLSRTDAPNLKQEDKQKSEKKLTNGGL